ncbi:MAG: 16S rRNA (guanine(527)-N(7))-methyltransferase RsmG [Fimbriimonadales bacterium]|nr:16S rRNA (guanine(527)-N(7))-methyltransferase RsmG [Fimbriimonadales bacterium]MDW8051701.1 16S rRNA (guanine(527)-N(7))-methyltransferase RsmG [Armatimonadota bacterium]
MATAPSIGDWSKLQQLPQWGIMLSEAQMDLLRRYLTLLYAANQQMNLTRVPPEQAVGRHLLDSLCLLRVYPFPQGARVLDIGTGAGLPGIPLAVARPDLKITLLDSHRKTTNFLQETCAALGIDAEIVWARAEEWAHSPSAREQFDVVVARAVAQMPILAELMVPFLCIGGVGLALKSVHEQEEIQLAEPAAQLLGASLDIHLVTYEAEEGVIQRAVAMLRKQHPTPTRYPRAWAQITKRPLGGKP